MREPIEETIEMTPLVQELSNAPDPYDAFLRFADCPRVLFLDSAAPERVHGRYSYLAAHPSQVVVANQRSVTIEVARSTDLDDHLYVVSRQLADVDPFDVVKEQLASYRAEPLPDLPPFQGGAAGLFSYGLSRVFERIPEHSFDEFETPDLVVGIYDWVLAWDHERGSCHLLSCPIDWDMGHKEHIAAQRADSVITKLEGPASAPPPARTENRIPRERLAPSWPVPNRAELLSDFSKDDYVRAIARAIEYVHAGDVFQVNLSQRLLAPLTSTSLEFYSALRRNNPAPFAAYFDFGDFVVASSSPEQFLGLDGDEVVTRPIKGTRSRGYTAEEEIYRRLDLKESEKDRAENVMIVDLLRNDLSRVCLPHTVTVPRLFEVERHPTVHHLVSEVRGQLRDDCGALDLLRSSFPGGSITGAPKVRAMEIIAELEPTDRGFYCGSLAWIAFHGGMGSSILIRTVTLGRGWMQLPVGGGIVADSSPEAEYQETLDKAAGMVRALI